MTIDFSQLYAELGLHPDCSLEAFQRAYRRCLSERHPDRVHSGSLPDGALPLSDLIALHSSAMAFHRSHGRLPGGTAAIAVPHAAHVSRTPTDTSATHDGHSTTWRWVLAILLLSGSLLLGVIHEQPQPEPGRAASEPQAANAGRFSLPPDLADGPLELGMDAQTVRGIQGEPMRINDNLWEYGPSWLRFEHGELVDWYSSPLYRLKTRTPSPASDAESAKTYRH